MPLAAFLPSTLFRTSFFSSLSKFKTLALYPLPRHALDRFASSSLCPHVSLRPILKYSSPQCLARSMASPLSTAAAMTTPNPETSSLPTMSKKARRASPEGLLRRDLDMCSKNGDLPEALRLYDAARTAAIPLSLHHFNVLLYLCSSFPSPSGLERGFEIYRQMGLDGVSPNEATFTSLARLASAKEDPDLAFHLVKQMASSGIPPKLRSFGPALFGFCKKGEVEKAHEVEAYMADSGIEPEENELAALLHLNVRAGRGEDVYRLLHRMRTIVRRVSESTAEIIEGWFDTEAAKEVGLEKWDINKVKERMVKGGGGWHGQGWLGKGRWKVGKTEMDDSGVCRRCGEKLVCIDIDPVETEAFANSLARLASEREVRADFTTFKDWLDRHGPFHAVLDAANIALNKQLSFNFLQLNSVVNGMRQLSPSKKLPLIIMHSHRTKSGTADKPNNKRLLESWRKAGSLYATPPGSNDDWYWLYAAVRCRSLLVTNDEMRDHLFELLGTSFFPRWKEKHQVRLTFSKNGLNFHMPPPYSVVIQESEDGKWHIPTVSGDDIETPRQWICATRSSSPPAEQIQTNNLISTPKMNKPLSSLF
ncbi:proteinaceous RNase P 1, chloroplastic/mitochondrial-like [Canna indica]|uniref:ribonuclease P n=1 Tax=Canna indica TaxID=4628 RepID=A0AAQ3PZ90_9LILI|nr:proteinaceous RNase P 1, chloroplastic/mitochondrial-like [Canna indica]